MERLKRAQHYLRSGSMVRHILAYIGLVFGMELIMLGRVPQLAGVATSLERIFPVPAVMHGAALAFVSLALAWATAQHLRGATAILLVINVSFYSCVATAALFAAHLSVFVVCASAAGASGWQCFAVMWGGSAYVVRGSHHDTGFGGVGGRSGVHRLRRDERH